MGERTPARSMVPPSQMQGGVLGWGGTVDGTAADLRPLALEPLPHRPVRAAARGPRGSARKQTRAKRSECTGAKKTPLKLMGEMYLN